MPEKGFDSFSNTGESDERAGNRGRGGAVFDVATSREEREKLFAEIEELERKIAEEKALQREIEEKLNRIRASKGATEGSEGGDGKNDGASGDVLSDAMSEIRDIAQGKGGATAEEIVEEVKEEEGGNEDTPDDGETEPDSVEEKKKKTEETAKRDRKIGAFLAGVAILGLIGGIIGSRASKRDKNAEAPEPLPTAMTEIMPGAVSEEDFVAEEAEAEKVEASKYSGELVNGVFYDYSEYADRQGKKAYNAFGYDASDCYGDVEKTQEWWMKTATEQPDALGSYAYFIFTEQEKQELGIAGMSEGQIGEYMSDVANADGGAMQSRLLEKMQSVINEEGSSYDYYLEYGLENTRYEEWIDSNGDGMITPDEIRLGYDTVQRHGVPQFDFYRTFNGERVKMIDINLGCGNQANTSKAPDLPIVPETPVDPEKPDEPSGPEETPTPTEVTPVPDEPVPEESPAPEESPTPTEVTPVPDEPAPEESPVPVTPTPVPETPAPVLPTPLITPTPTPVAPTPDMSKDADNMTRIDDDIKSRIEYDYGTNEVVIPQATANPQSITTQPPAEAYQETEATIVENESAPAAQPVQDYVSYANDYSQNLGGTNATEYAPVQPDQAGLDAADDRGDTAAEASDIGASLGDILG